MWQELWYLVSHLKPNYIESDISFSAGDPALTGKITGAVSLLPVLYRYDAQVYPDFLSEEAYIRGRLKMKGHMALFHFVRSLIRLIRDENIRKLYDIMNMNYEIIFTSKGSDQDYYTTEN